MKQILWRRSRFAALAQRSGNALPVHEGHQHAARCVRPDRGVPMFKLTGLKPNFRRAAFGMLAGSAVALSAPAGAAPLPLFSFATPPAPSAAPAQAAPEQNDGTASELP